MLILTRTFFLAALAAVLYGASAAYAQAQDEFHDEPAYMARLAHQSMLLDGAVKPSGGLVAVGERGHILLSDDGGRTWQQAPVPTRSTLTAVRFVDDSNGWAVGHDAVILRTVDGGASWQKVYFDPEDQRPLFGVYFTDARNGIAVGAYGLYMVSDDGGQSWRQEDIVLTPFPDDEDADQDSDGSDDDMDDMDDGEDAFFDYHLNHITGDDTGRLYIAAESGHFFRSDDAGATWHSMETPYEGSYYSTVPLGGDRLLLLAMRGNLLLSTDAGRTFETIDTGTKELLGGGLRLKSGRVVVVGMAGVVMLSDDGGESFDLVPQPDRTGLATAINAGTGTVVLLGEAGAQRREMNELAGSGLETGN